MFRVGEKLFAVLSSPIVASHTVLKFLYPVVQPAALHRN